MIRVYIQKIIITEPPAPSVLILIPKDDYERDHSCRIVPIYISWEDAAQLSLAMSNRKTRRPVTHELFIEAIRAFDTVVEKVTITKAIGKVFYSQLYLVSAVDQRQVCLDARPTDSLSLAIREGAPIYISEKAFEDQSFPFIFRRDNTIQEMREFHEYVQNLTPDDLTDAFDEIPLSPDELFSNERENKSNTSEDDHKGGTDNDNGNGTDNDTSNQN